MIGPIAKTVLSAASHAAWSGAVGGLKGGFLTARSELGEAFAESKGSEAGAAEAVGEAGATSPLSLLALGLFVAGSAIVFVPSVRDAALDFHDGALRKLGTRARGWLMPVSEARAAEAEAGTASRTQSAATEAAFSN